VRGRVVGKYKILDQIGEGGMGVVYRAEHVVLGSPAAIKILQPQFTRDGVVVDRFFTEAKATSAINHVGIVQVFDYGRLPDERAFIAMELLRGEDLAGFLGRHTGGIAPAIAAQIALQLLGALEAAHLIGVVHRDLKPDNIFLLRDHGAPGGIRVKILDFGIAKLVGDQLGSAAPRQMKTRGDTLLGTPAYMAPEQCRGGVAIDARADLYAIGCLLFEMLVGRPPFQAEGNGEIMAMQIYQDPPRLAQHAPALSPELDALVARLLAKSPDDRTPSAAWALAALERIALPPLAGEVPLIERAPTAPAASSSVSIHETSLPRWIPITVIAVALLLAAAAAAAIGLS
jgi:eukaryotic-like serine/threonine-protein kinase